MKKILLVTNSLFEYRLHIYNEFIELFHQYEFEFIIVLINDYKRKILETNNRNYLYIKSGYPELKKALDREKPDVLINFLAPSNKMLWFLFLYSKLNKLPNITWTHAVNLQDPKNKAKRVIYNLIHNLSTALILYSKNERKYVRKKYHHKIFVANNTISFKNIPNIKVSVEKTKNLYGIFYDKTVLFVGRMQKRKKLEVLINIFKEPRFLKYGLVIAGPGFDDHYKKLIKNHQNMKYLGAIFEPEKINEIFKSSDLFCIPGTNGLGINQAMYWGLPCLALNVNHSPEIIYLVNNETGFIVNTPNELSDKIYYLLENDIERQRISMNAKNKIVTEASIQIMFDGFLKAINYSLEKH